MEPPRTEYKGFKYKYNIKGDILRLLVNKTRKILHDKDGKTTKFNSNSGITIKKKSEPRSKYINGPINFSIKRRKFISLFGYTV